MTKQVKTTKKNKKKIEWKPWAVAIGSVGLLVMGMVGTLEFQEFVENTKVQGVEEYKDIYCEDMKSEDNKHWLYCKR